MAYRVTVKCQHCGKETPVPQVGAIPQGWITIGYVRVKLEGPDNQGVVEHFCSWRHAFMFVKTFVSKKEVEPG